MSCSHDVMPPPSAAPAPPWAQVLPPQSARPDCDSDVREHLEQIKQDIRQEVRQEVRSGCGELRSELRSAALRQRDADELEQTRQRLQNLDQQRQKELEESRQIKEELSAQLAQTELKLQEAEQRLAQEAEEHEKKRRELIRARHDYDCAVISKERLELEHRTNQDRNQTCVDQMTQRFEHVTQKSEQQKQRCIDLERIKEELEEQVRQLQSQNTSLESQAGERERELQGRLGSSAEASRRLEGEKRIMEAELEKVRQAQREVEQETRELRCRTAVLEDQLRDSQEQRQRSEQDQQRSEQDLRQWYQKFIDSNKENTVLQRANQDHKRDIWDLENQLRQERNVANIAKPGEYLKLMKAHEGDSLATDNTRLKKALTKTQTDLDLCIRRLHEQDKVIKDLNETLHSCKGSRALS